MIDGKPVLGVILARGGSKRLPGKNVRAMCGKPMIAWTIEAALASKTIDRLVLSSDDDEIMEAARAEGCEVPFRRPAELAGDEVTSADAVYHALRTLGIDEGYLVLLQPTSPLRTAQDIDSCVEHCCDEQASTCATVNRLPFPPEWLVTLDRQGRVTSPVRDTAHPLYVPNGAVYVVEVPWFLEHRKFWVEGVTVGHETLQERSIDVDTLEDFELAEYFMKKQKA